MEYNFAGEVNLCLAAGLQLTIIFISNNPSVVFSIHRFLGLFWKMFRQFSSFYCHRRRKKEPEDVHVLEAAIILIACSDLINSEWVHELISRYRFSFAFVKLLSRVNEPSTSDPVDEMNEKTMLWTRVAHLRAILLERCFTVKLQKCFVDNENVHWGDDDWTSPLTFKIIFHSVYFGDGHSQISKWDLEMNLEDCAALVDDWAVGVFSILQ